MHKLRLAAFQQLLNVVAVYFRSEVLSARIKTIFRIP